MLRIYVIVFVEMQAVFVILGDFALPCYLLTFLYLIFNSLFLQFSFTGPLLSGCRPCANALTKEQWAV